MKYLKLFNGENNQLITLTKEKVFILKEIEQLIKIALICLYVHYNNHLVTIKLLDIFLYFYPGAVI